MGPQLTVLIIEVSLFQSVHNIVPSILCLQMAEQLSPAYKNIIFNPRCVGGGLQYFICVCVTTQLLFKGILSPYMNFRALSVKLRVMLIFMP